jgi:hypothetical protein
MGHLENDQNGRDGCADHRAETRAHVGNRQRELLIRRQMGG